MATLDRSMAIALFEEQNGRKPMVPEMPQIDQVIVTVGFLAPKDDLIRQWEDFHKVVVPPGEVNWDEFARMGCLDGKQ